MKNILLIIVAFLVLPFVGNSQSKSDKMYDTFSNSDGVLNFSFTKNMLDVVVLNIGDDGDERKVTGDLHEVRFISYNSNKGRFSGNEFIKKAISFLPNSSYKEYKDGNGDDAWIFLMGKRKKFKECHLFIGNNDQNNLRFIISFFGDFRVEDLDGLTAIGKNMSNKD